MIPRLIVAGLAYPAARMAIEMKDTGNPDLTIKVTGYQRKWRYSYINENLDFHSELPTPRDQIESSAPRGELHLVEVDHPLVVPVGNKIRILATSDDVIYSWWVPALGVKQDAIPGLVRDSWFRVDEPGAHRRACTELCGKEHRLRPFVVEALPGPAYKQWVTAEQAKRTANSETEAR